MATVHFLNVKQGDCSIIQHDSGRVSVIDVSNAKPIDAYTSFVDALVAVKMAEGATVKRVSGNFNQKAYPVNPIQYLKDHSIEEVFRYIQTHPDMDHMDGIEYLFETFKPVILWDTDNHKENSLDSWEGSPYNIDDWVFYKKLRDSNPQSDPKRLTNLSGDQGQYWSRNEDGTTGGDAIQILAPTQQLIDTANAKDDDYNDCSYVLLFRAGQDRIVFGGDSHDATWEHILSHWESDVTDIDLLIAPHHGRKSGRSYEFLDTLNPTVTFFGNAPS